MNTTLQVAKHIRESAMGNNWTDVCLKNSLQNISWQQANISIAGCNSIAVLAFHIGYYVKAILQVMQGGALEAHDKFSFDAPAINNDDEWNQRIKEVLANIESLANSVMNISDEVLEDFFTQEKYGNYYRNLHGVTEHLYYHMGQINLLKKMILAKVNDNQTIAP
jgi:uncharacterized damage-inducible protein DinB